MSSAAVTRLRGGRAQIAAVEALGFSRGEPASVDLRRSLDETVPQPQLPPGFRIQSQVLIYERRLDS